MAGRPNRGKGTPTADWQPRPAKPFAPKRGVTNLAVVEHGASSPILVSDEAKIVLTELMEMLPYLHEADGLLLDALVRDKIMFDRYSRYEEQLLDEVITNRKGETGIEAVPRNVIDRLAALSRNIQSGCRALGMTPTDRATLFKDQSWAKALGARAAGPALGQQGRELREARGRGPADDGGRD